VLPFLREDRLSVDDDVVLALRALARGGVEPVLLQLGRETRGPAVVSASDGAVQDLDGHRRGAYRLVQSRELMPPPSGVVNTFRAAPVFTSAIHS